MALKTTEVLPPEFDSQEASFVRSHFQIKIPSKFDYHKDVLNPEFFRQHQRLKIGDIITVISEIGAFDCDLRVVAADKGYAVVRPLREWFAPEVAESIAPGKPSLRFVPGAGFTVFDTNGEPVSRHPTKDAAEAALAALKTPLTPEAIVATAFAATQAA